ncbi:hypothetical protein C923_05545 [Plasmodium falciparum UGT5.1]|uniref:Uncharacterized protein n=7 Tax=Plasmodium falciparum TaxID=5833 RepID=W4IXI4_PLAFP|nr:hypothetical protein PFFVO_05058 [Plasmodium falciparum Vietnam Oak-Knoll (FVO)]ETW29068.1 hypothetical protein PFFCH_03489 [Plasmodium falciparum FCH/4]ETW39835.1 hypothetical protein PFNF135_05863 [Plasmodium falciparum NF135/5.C10]ETW46736.1 hypothetical protein PFMALIP_05260 [Plasmodium falciparum MaliPS096_E11]ETW54087.1 hypothetical protein PFUGPA_03958 [Plasmodium falciparum Palo Alto/Uganda]ETW58393.1 hypothetical protein PFMC_05495 [Plasmodium falciparum CAMP/Malaysia]EWC73802.1 h
MNDCDTKKFRDISEKIHGKYVPIIKFGGSKKYIKNDYKNEDADINNISYASEFLNNNVDIYYDNKYGINKVCFSPQGKYVAGCTSNGFIYLYDLYENKLLSKICTRIDNIQDIAISDNDKYIYACGENRLIEIFDIYEENRKRCNNDIGKYVDVSIPSIIKNTKLKMKNCSESDNMKHNNNILSKNALDNKYIPYHKTKYKNISNGKSIYIPIYNYEDLIKSNINMIDLNYVKLNKVNEIINKSTFLIKESHEYITSCIAIPNICNFLVYSGGGDGVLKIWDLRMNLFNISKKSSRSNKSDIIFIDNKNPFASICSHEDTVTSITFNKTIDHEGSYKLKKEQRKKKKIFNSKKECIDNKNVYSSSLDCENMNDSTSDYEEDRESDNSSVSSPHSSICYSSLTFDLSKDKFNNILMTSGYDGYIRLYDISNNIIKSFYDEEKSITHCMFSNNNKYIISTNKSKFGKVFDFMYMNNKMNSKNMATYLNNYKTYCLNKPLIRKENLENENYHDTINEDDIFSSQLYNDKEYALCKIGNIFEDEELEERIKIVNELNRKINEQENKHFEPNKNDNNNNNNNKDNNNKDKNKNNYKKYDNNKYYNNNDNNITVEHDDYPESNYSNSDSSIYDENTIKSNTFYEHVNNKLEPTWSLFVDNLKYMDLVPYDNINDSLKYNYNYVKSYFNHNNFLNTNYHSLNIDEKEPSLYYMLSEIISNEDDIPKFSSCIAGDKCIIPSIDTYAHVYDLYTGFHVNSIKNLYLPNYYVDNHSYYSHSIDTNKKRISFLTSVDTYPKNQNIIATSNGYPDGSIVLWAFVAF